jgi:hypothetical protein
MKSPFPGMDPYLEDPRYWRDFHDSFIYCLREAIQPLVLPKYAALSQHRVYLMRTAQIYLPDVSILRTGHDLPSGGGVAATADQPTVVDFASESVREPFVTIVDPSDENRIVTVIEVLSPDNKRPGRGRISYLRKRKELWQAGANLVEIDLLRDGKPTVRTAKPTPEGETPSYAVVVSRAEPTQCERYAFTLRDRFPRISLPLDYGVPDVMLDLGLVFERCYATSPYGVIIDRTQLIAGPASGLDRDWSLHTAAGNKSA